MYEFHYDYINKYGHKSRLLFTDTDSLMSKIITENVYEYRKFDFSNYSTKSKYYDITNKLVVGKMEDETASVFIEEFVGLKPKMYSYLTNDNNVDKQQKV